MLLQEAERAGITIDQRSIPLRELQACMLAGKHLIIALVDKRRLCCGFMWNRPTNLQLGGVNCLPTICGYGDEYTGTPGVCICMCGIQAGWLGVRVTHSWMPHMQLERKDYAVRRSM